jgi:uncharacterized protein YbjQ (UPF0145 family)
LGLCAVSRRVRRDQERRVRAGRPGIRGRRLLPQRHRRSQLPGNRCASAAARRVAGGSRKESHYRGRARHPRPGRADRAGTVCRTPDGDRPDGGPVRRSRRPRASGCPPLARPFACDLSGPDFAKLLIAGWVPAGIALGISVAGLHDDLLTTRSGPWGAGNAEVPTYTDLMIQVRQDARSHLEQAAHELDADGVVVSATALHVRSDACQAHPGGTDHFAEAVITGTAVARFAGRRKTTLPPSLAVLPLDAGNADQRADRDRRSRSATRQRKTRPARSPAAGTSTPGALSRPGHRGDPRQHPPRED